MGEPVIELFGETAFKNTLDKDPGKHKVHEKPEKRDIEVNINPEGKHDEDVNVGNMNNAVRKRLYKKTEKRDRKDDITDTVLLNTEYEAGIKTHQGRELSTYEKPDMRNAMLKTNHQGKYNDDVHVNNVMEVNNAAASIEDQKLYHDIYYQYSTSKQAIKKKTC
jgi:hypothetical protein